MSRELDALVAEKVFGWKWVRVCEVVAPGETRTSRILVKRGGWRDTGRDADGSEPLCRGWDDFCHFEPYSANLDHAGKVLDFIAKQRPTVYCRFVSALKFLARNEDPLVWLITECNDRPKAICLAALEAMTEQGEN
jgi:hypothetical protein